MNDLRMLPIPRALSSVALAAIVLVVSPTARAHDEHDNLPSTGVAVKGDRLIISAEAEKSLGVATAVVHLETLERDVMANAAIEVPWRQHAFATSLVAGRVAKVLVQPGDRVEQGQELAGIESQEIETLQLNLLKAATELDLASRLLEERGPGPIGQHLGTAAARIANEPRRVGSRARHRHA